MTDLENRLDQALKADSPPPRDPMFRIAVMERRTRTMFKRRLMAASALAFAAAIVGVAGLGAVETLPDGAGRLAAIAGIGAVLAAAMAAPWLGGMQTLRRLAAQASWAMRSATRLWP